MNVQINPDEVLGQYGNLVYQLALAQMKQPADAEDIFQEVFLRLVRTQQNFESPEHLKAWLIRVTINCSRSLWKSAWRQKVVPFETDVPEKEKDESSELYAQVMRLPKKYRIVIHLFYYEDMSIESISHALNIGYDAVAKRLSRARNLLKQQLTGEEDNEEYAERIPHKCKSTPSSR